MIDLRSDTVTKPTDDMRQAMFRAEVGDDVYGEDPTVNKLEETAADLLGKEAALFVTSGTQGNQIAVLTHCQPGQEIILENESHIYYYEGAAISALAGVQPRPITGQVGIMSPNDVEYAIRPEDIHFPETGLICLENTHNRAGGAIVPVEAMASIDDIARKHHVPVHLDGARLFNAAVATNRKPSEYAQFTTSVQICLSKGLGAPVGSIIAGDKDFIDKARKWRKRLGGGLRQAGVLAAPGLIAITKMVDRLSEDHEKAQLLATAIQNMSKISLLNSVDTNIVVIDISKTGYNATEFVEALEKKGVRTVTFGQTTVRMTTHYDVSFEDIETAIGKLAELAR